jgi:hypothetical protein
VTHGLVCQVVVRDHLRVPASPERFDNTGVTMFDAAPPHAAAVVNCTRHLGDAELVTPLGSAPV